MEQKKNTYIANWFLVRVPRPFNKEKWDFSVSDAGETGCCHFKRHIKNSKGLNLEAKTIQIEENIKEKFHNIRHGINFLNMNQKHKSTKRKNRLHIIKIKSFVH